ncbi:DTW domain-containing protein [Chlamydoabsidia padenii]|nr:DTW domain-containing protein [Chlamydoabsidia padenii]
MDRKRERSPSSAPMSDLQIDDDTILHNTSDRHKCPKCEKTVKYFCYRCFDVVGMDRSQVPTVKLPVHLDVIKHERELDGKSTAIHARVLAPDNVTLYGYNQIPTYDQPERTLLLFPGPNAKTLKEIPRESFDRIVVLDGTWRQATRMAREAPQLQGLQQITIAPRKTQFWRFQQKSENHLATIEAIYYTYREYAEAYEQGDYHGQYDNLMYYYRFFYHLIQDRYRQNHDRTFNRRHRQDYIQYDQGNKKQKVQGDQDGDQQSDEDATKVDTSS